MTTMLETLDETVAAYTLKTRAAIDNFDLITIAGGRCRYFIDGLCCPVGRCLANPVKFEDTHCTVVLLDKNYGLESILKPEYRGFPIAFWAALQNLHDMPSHWDENGLSDHGRRVVDDIKERFKL